jgi:hypothetical protein
MLVGSAHAQSGAQSATVSERIVVADERFKKLVSKTPDMIVDAAIFFTNDMSLEQLRMYLQHPGFQVKGFRHGTPSYAGGYTLLQGETLDQAIESYRRDHLAFLRQRMVLEDRMTATEQNREAREALLPHRKEAEQMIADFDKNGVRVIAIEARGKAKEIADFKEKVTFVRVIELTDAGTPQPAILPGN